jgi:hypothetical protein
MAESGKPNIINLTLTSQSTEYSTTFGGNTNIKKLLVKSRDLTQTLQLAFTSGASGTTYITIPPGNSYYEENLHASVVLYVQCTTAAGVVAEIIYWI